MVSNSMEWRRSSLTIDLTTRCKFALTNEGEGKEVQVLSTRVAPDLQGTLALAEKLRLNLAFVYSLSELG